ncbi:MAG: hypothetical protein ACPGUC_08080, partial [Gammaproteobacteria bacterium]
MRSAPAEILALMLSIAWISAPPARASDARGLNEFAQGISICVRFGAYPWMARSRFEDVGWKGINNPDWQTLSSPRHAVTAYVSPRDAPLPLFCRVESERVSLNTATHLAWGAVQETGYALPPDTDETGCPRFRLTLGAEVLVTSAGNGGTC